MLFFRAQSGVPPKAAHTLPPIGHASAVNAKKKQCQTLTMNSVQNCEKELSAVRDRCGDGVSVALIVSSSVLRTQFIMKIDAAHGVAALRGRGSSLRGVARALHISVSSVRRCCLPTHKRNRKATSKMAKKSTICEAKKRMLCFLLRVRNPRTDLVFPSLRRLSRAARDRGVDLGSPSSVRHAWLRLLDPAARRAGVPRDVQCRVAFVVRN